MEIEDKQDKIEMILKRAQRTVPMIKFDSQSTKGFPRKLMLMEPRVTTLKSCM
jgi:hypothetical protein